MSSDPEDETPPEAVAEVATGPTLARAPLGPPVSTPPEQVARAALARARAAARAKGLRPGDRPRRMVAPASGTAGPDARDPQPLSASARRLAADLGWGQELVAGGLAERWPQVVGAQVAEHCEYVGLDAGVLTVQASSTAWATNLRLMTSSLLARIGEEVGDGVVVEVIVLGPSGPGFGRGRRRVPGRGPRDTWG
ncbi:MAG: DciA family protein [Cellulomonas sp.]|nr:DciA family protein [Cellulomonas sp.]